MVSATVLTIAAAHALPAPKVARAAAAPVRAGGWHMSSPARLLRSRLFIVFLVAIGCTQLARLDPARVNVRGGAVALGHPIGCSGARILTTLVYALRETGGKRGLATLCIGGGEANALLIERV